MKNTTCVEVEYAVNVCEYIVNIWYERDMFLKFVYNLLQNGCFSKTHMHVGKPLKVFQ